jgi:hypothetical protein
VAEVGQVGGGSHVRYIFPDGTTRSCEFLEVKMKLSFKGMVFATAILWGSALLIVGLLNLANPNYGVNFLQLANSVYPWFQSTHSWRSVLVGTLDGAADGAIAAVIFVWIYNAIVTGDVPRQSTK